MTGKLVAGLSKILSRVLRFVFASFTEDMGADVQGIALLFCLVS
ncbi:hypothetical protein BAZSYMB_SCAFFOLD00008_0 [Bathymodiolus azoricus thioautotrophic gill symbiont]|uniref:Uncharacterized protein n=1 Tax=Bathymodiolus azoricus thioautotrophic gill symbiont TaxID=235205 RepID=A0A1H6M184_9GAMM|nr:hypothetical protein BAZSYMB_SCAFFOLD00008_0 [Bathymodiolus azoricus thioautotrophic gill symbiont]